MANGTSDEDWKEYCASRRIELENIRVENQRVLGRNTLLISGAALTLSIAMVKDLFPNPAPWTKLVLVSSWCLFGLSAFLQFYSDHWSSKAVEEEEKVLDAQLAGDNQAGCSPNRYDKRVQWTNKVTPWLICLGVACMLVFSTVNFLGQGVKSMTKKQAPMELKDKNDKQEIVKKGVTMPPRKQPPKQKPSQKPEKKND